MLPIYVDFDDVLADTTSAFLKILELEFGKRVNFEDIFSFDLQASFGLGESEFEHFFQRVHQPEVIMAFAPIEGAVGVLQEWITLGYQISIVTGRLTSAYAASLDWLSKHNEFSLAVEDSAKMALHLSQKMGIPVALIDRPWNRRANLNPKISRYTSWYDIRNDFQTP
jgi:uncharacterized HAD superfamily protein